MIWQTEIVKICHEIKFIILIFELKKVRDKLFSALKN